MMDVKERICPMALRVGLGVFFIYVGGEKFFRLESFYEDILNYELVGEQMAEWMTFLVPTVEILVGLSLLIHWFYTGGLVLMGALLLSFIVALSSAWARGLEISCGCAPWAAEERTNYALGIGMNVLLLAMVVLLFLCEKRYCQRLAAFLKL